MTENWYSVGIKMDVSNHSIQDKWLEYEWIHDTTETLSVTIENYVTRNVTGGL